MSNRVKKAILTGGMLICFIGVVFSYSVGFDWGMYFNGGILLLLLLGWVSTFKEDR